MQRRQFIHRLGTATIGSLATPELVHHLWAKSKMKLGLVTYLWAKDWDVPTIIKNCTASGVLGVELRTEHAHGVDPGLPTARQNDVKKMFADSAVTLLGLGSNQDYHHPEPEKLKASIEKTKAFIRLSQAVGGSGVKVKPNAFPAGIPPQKTIEQIGRALNDLGRFGADYGQEIRLEVHGEVTQELPNIKAIMDIADHPNVKVCWNCNDQDLWGEGLAHNFNLVRHRFDQTVHVRELDLGPYPYQDLFNLLVASKYSGWVLLECRTDPADKVAALKQQQHVFQELIKKARRS